VSPLYATIIGVVPPCPRCKRIYDLTVEILNELGINATVKKVAFDSEEAQRYGRTGTAHHVAAWAQINIDWEKIWALASEGWSKELDEALMPCKERADAEGWLMTPVLLINDKVIFTGYVPDKEVLKRELENHYQKEVDTL